MDSLVLLTKTIPSKELMSFIENGPYSVRIMNLKDYFDLQKRDFPIFPDHLSPKELRSLDPDYLYDVGFGPGTYLSSYAIIAPGATIGRLSLIEAGAVIGEEAIIGECCLVKTGAVIGRNARIDHGCIIGTGAVIADGVHIGSNKTIRTAEAVISDQVFKKVYAKGRWLERES